MHTEDRLHSLDALRAFALVAGIVLHSTMSFMPGLASVGYPADRSLSPTLQVVFYVIHVFRMALFFFLAGYFAHLMYHRKGAAGFLRDRARRIAAPLLGGWLLFGPMTMVLVYLAFGPSIAGAPAGASGRGVPLAHLWFLYYLLWAYAAIPVVRTVAARMGRDGQLHEKVDASLRWLVLRPNAPVVLAAPIALCLYFTPNWVLWAGIASPDTGLVPQWPAATALGSVFTFGWLIHRQADLLVIPKRRWALHLIAAVILTAASLWQVNNLPNPMAPGAFPKAVYAVTYAVAIWNWIFGLVGAAQRFCARESAVGRYMADASYWMYLAHLPLVFALQLIVRDWPLHWSVKFPSILIVAIGILLVSYHYLVRATWVGRMLNGRTYPRRWPWSAGEALSADAVQAGVAIP